MNPALAPYTLIALDDEPLALRLMERYVQDLPAWQLGGTFTDAAAAATFLRSHAVDLLLVDINMPDMTGLEFVRALPEVRPLVILVTAYQEHALAGFELDVVDYLVKPVAPPRFAQALDRAAERLTLLRKAQMGPTSDAPPACLYVYAEYQQVKIPIADICYIESMGDYVKIFVVNQAKPILTLHRLKALTEELAPHGLRRIHRSYLVHLAHMEARQKSRVKVAGTWLPVGETYLGHLEGW
jgi:DNA-binding LytR/AlgR family response regulator